jgi:hypothetical protein
MTSFSEPWHVSVERPVVPASAHDGRATDREGLAVLSFEPHPVDVRREVLREEKRERVIADNERREDERDG